MMSAWLWGILLAGAMVLLAIAGTLLTRRWVGAETLKSNNEVAGFIYAVIGVVYAVLLGFSAIIVWEQYDKAIVVVEQEANQLADLFRDAQTFPSNVQTEVENRLRTYAELVIEKEWPAMADGQSSPEAWEAYNQLWGIYHRFVPENEHQRSWYEASLVQLNDLGDQRRLRLLSSRAEGVPSIMWVVLIGAGTITVCFALLFGTKNLSAQVLMIAGLATTIALVLFSIFAMHEPFAGITRIEPEAFHQVLMLFDLQSQQDIDQSSLPAAE